MKMNDSDIIDIINNKLKDGIIDESDFKFLIDSNRNLKDYIIKTSENLHRVSLSYPELLNKLDKKENFSMMRIQDGEWTCIFKIEPHYTNKMLTRYKSKDIIDELSLKLFEIVKNRPNYYICVNAGTLDQRINIVWPHIKHLNNLVVGEIFRRVSVEKGLDDFINILKKRDVIIVGPFWLSNLKNIFNFTHIISPFPDLYNTDNINNLTKEIENKILSTINNNPVILYSCAIVAKVLIDKFYKKFEKSITQIDMGAIWDPYCGKVTRPYHKKVIKRIEEKNK
jgi:6-pyruvoyl-tetrahydropterin synthase